MSPTANASSSSAASRADLLELDLAAAGLLPPLPRAFLAGEHLDLLAPYRLVPPGADAEAALDALAAAGGPEARAPGHRPELARALAAANTAYGHPRAGELGRLLAAPGTTVVVTGQQPGLFGGPLYTLSKMAAATRWAERLTEAGRPAVAVFWVATEDHDFNEVARAGVLAPDGLVTVDLGEDPAPLTPVGMRSLGDGVETALATLEERIHGERYAGWLATLGRWYRPGARFGEAFTRLAVHLLGERCPLLLDSMLAEVKALERPVLERLVERREELDRAYAEADSRLEARGLPLQVSPQPGVSPLFLHCGRNGGEGGGDDGGGGERRRIEWRGEAGWTLRGRDEAGGPVGDLLERIAENPAAVSPGVLARPAVQDALLGTGLFLVGPGELSYLPQAAAAYEVLGVPAPAVALRPQVLVLERRDVERIEEIGVPLPALLGPREALDRLLAERAHDAPSVAPARERIEAELDRLESTALAVDGNLESPLGKTRDQVLSALDTFAGKLDAAVARGDRVRAERIDRLRETALPGGSLQERVVCSSHFPGKHGERFVASLLEQLDLDPATLQVVVP